MVVRGVKSDEEQGKEMEKKRKVEERRRRLVGEG